MAEPATNTRPWLGDLLILAAAVIFSTAGLFTGLIGTDVWTILFWRGLFGGAFIAGFLAWRHGGAAWSGLRSSGWPGLVAGACSTAGTICFIHALRQTSVANVTIIFATAPFIAAALAWLWIGERPSRSTIGASALALGGVLVTVAPALTSGHLPGDLLALAMTALIATMMVVIRRHRELSMLPAACLSAFACAALALPFADPAAVTPAEFLWLAVFGSVQFGLGLLLLTLGSRRMPGSRAALLGNIELPLAPLWVWLAVGEVPPPASWIGGAVVVVALVLEMGASHRGAREARRPSAGPESRPPRA